MDSPKERLRATMRGRLARIGRVDRRERSSRIAEQLFACALWREARAVLSYLALPSEVDTEPINREALGSGKLVALPRIEGDGLSFRAVTDLNGPWERNSYRIREPAGALPPLRLGALLASGASVLLLIPGLAFDRRGGRLGRGKGFYDRFLSTLGRPGPAAGFSSIGVCFEEQIVASVPTGPLDCVVDHLLTEAGVLATLRLGPSPAKTLRQ